MKPGATQLKALVTMVGMILSGCAIVSQPPRPFSAEALKESSGAAYLWSAGKVKQPVFSLQDFAIVTRIDDKPIPSEYRPDAGMEPLVAWRIEVPAGQHVIEIVNKECIFSPLSGIGGCAAFEQSLHSIEFTAVPGRAYTPIVDEKCGQKWFWIADSGQVDPAGAQKMSPLPFIENAPAVGGVKPQAGPCPAPATEAANSHTAPLHRRPASADRSDLLAAACGDNQGCLKRLSAAVADPPNVNLERTSSQLRCEVSQHTAERLHQRAVFLSPLQLTSSSDTVRL